MADSPQPVPVSFAEFPVVTTAQWQERLARDLKGQDPATLTWQTPDGFPIAPFYHQEALEELGGAPAPQVRPATTWRNVPTYVVPTLDRGHAAIDRAADGPDTRGRGRALRAGPRRWLRCGVPGTNSLPLADTYVGYSVRGGAAALLAAAGRGRRAPARLPGV